jgi:putative Holliday junction resolvase
VTGRVLAVDYGTRRVGLALSDPTGVALEPLPPLPRRGDDQAAREVAAVAQRADARTIVVGLPLRTDGTEGPEAAAARAFARKVARYTQAAVRLWDERFTTQQADRLLVGSGLRRERRRTVRDGVAAALLLQSYLQAERNAATGPREDEPSPPGVP